MCCLHLWTHSAENYLLTFTSHSLLYNHLAYLKCILHLCRAQQYLFWPLWSHFLNGERCAHFLSAVAITSESIIICSGWGLVKDIYELCAPNFKCENTEENFKLPTICVEVEQCIHAVFKPVMKWSHDGTVLKKFYKNKERKTSTAGTWRFVWLKVPWLIKTF